MGTTGKTKSGRRCARRLNDLDAREWMRFTKSWFVCNPPPRNKDAVLHPAKFPEAMAEDFIRFFTMPGEVVLDPFAGVGSTLVAAEACGRRGVGIELSAAFVDVGRRLLAEEALLIQGDARNTVSLCRGAGIESVQYVLTSPPYWRMLKTSRGNVLSAHKERIRKGLPTDYCGDSADLSSIDKYDDFLAALVSILTDLRNLLDPGRYLTVVAQNIRIPEGRVCTFAWDLVYALSDYYTFKGERLWLQDNKRLGMWGYPSEFVTNVHHHYCLTFKNDKV